VIDTHRHTIKLYATDGGTKFLKRRSGTVEKQYRVNVGRLSVAYRTEPDGRYLYILDDAVTATMLDDNATDNVGRGKPPVPPCIVRTANGTRVALEIEDRGPRRVVLKISADSVRVQIKSNVLSGNSVEELLDFMRNVLGVKLSSMQLERGETPRHKLLTIDAVDPETVFDKLQNVLKTARNRHAY